VIPGCVAIILILGCQPQYADQKASRDARLTALSKAALTLDAEPVVEDTAVSAASGLALVGKELLLLDGRRSPAIHMYDANTGRRGRLLGARGDGIGEYRGAWSVIEEGNSRAFWVFDIQQRRATRYASVEAPAPDRIMAVRDSEVLTAMAPMADRSFLAPGYFHDGTIARVGYDGTILGKADGPPPGDTTIPGAVRAHGLESTVAVRPDAQAAALAFRYAGQLQIRGADGHLIASAEAPIVFGPDYDVARRRGVKTMAEPDRIRLGYVDVAVSRDAVYALFSGRTRAADKAAAESANELHVFDWQGHYRGAVRLSVDVSKVAVDEGDLYLYALKAGHPTSIVRFPLPPPLTASVEKTVTLRPTLTPGR
jgi:hypothetical protein